MFKALRTSMFVAKAMRCLRAMPRVWLDRFLDLISNSGQILTFGTACVGLYLALQIGATDAERDALSSQWALAIQAFGLALAAWAFVSLACAPWIVVKNDRGLGRWRWPKFVYHQPLLIATIHCARADADYRYHFKVADAEPDSFVYCTVEFDRPVGAMYAKLGGDIFTSNPPGPNSYSMFRLRAGNMATMILQNGQPDFHGLTARIYCHQFEVMNDQKS